MKGTRTHAGNHRVLLSAGRVHLAGKSRRRAGRASGGPAALTEVVHGLIVHEHMARMYGFELADERRASVHIRPDSRLLDQIASEDSRPLDVPRAPSAQVPGNCRHF